MTKLKDVTYNEKYPTYKIGKIDDNGNGFINGDYVDIAIGDKDFCIKYLTPENSKMKFPKFALNGNVVGGSVPQDELDQLKATEYGNTNFDLPAPDKANAAFERIGIVPGDTVRITYAKKEGFGDKAFFTYNKVVDGKVVVQGKPTKEQGGGSNTSTPPIPPEIAKFNEEVAGSYCTLLEREEEFVDLVLNNDAGVGMKAYIVDEETLRLGITSWLEKTYNEAYQIDESRLKQFYKEYTRRKNK